MAYSVYKHPLETWEYYPRVFYFSNILQDFVPRFRNISDHFGKEGEELVQDLENVRVLFSQPPEIQIIGECDLQEEAFIVEKPENNDQLKGNHLVENDLKIVIVICHSTVSSLPTLQHLGQYAEHSIRSMLAKIVIPLVLCQTPDESTEEDAGMIDKHIQPFFKQPFQAAWSALIVSTKRVSVVLPRTISDNLERRIVTCFQKVTTLVNDYLMHASSDSVFENSRVIEQLTNFLDTAFMRKSEFVNLDFVDGVVKSLGLAIKCAIIRPLSDKYNVQQEISNKTLIANDFENKVYDAVPKDVRLMFELFGNPQSTEDIKKMIDELKTHLRSVLSKAELEIGKSSKIFQKLLFEMNNHLKKSILGEKLDKRLIYNIDADVRKAILRLEGVLSVGTMYGEFEIHVESAVHVAEVWKNVADIFRKNDIQMPFTVKIVEKKLKLFCATTDYVHGSALICNTSFGTLGGFAEGNDSNLYGLTCAHVVSSLQVCDVDIQCNSQRSHFGRSVPQYIIPSGTKATPLIDLAAIRVSCDKLDLCFKKLRDQRGTYRKATLRTSTEGLAGSTVFKHGAKTLLTIGEVCSDDFTEYFDRDYMSYMLVIDTCVGSTSKFAEAGDSGAMVCMSNIDSASNIEAVGLLNGGDFSCGSSTLYCTCFLLNTAFEKLHSKTGLRLTFC